MPKFLRNLMLAGACAAATLGVSPVQAEEFTDAQREEIGEVVREYLMQNPEILRDVFQALEIKQQVAAQEAAKAAISENAEELFRSEHDLVAGNPDGNVTLVEFFDYNCGYCKRALPDVLKLIESDKDLKVVMKEFPILGPGSLYAAQAALASREQGKYWDFHLALLAEPGQIDAATVDRVAKEVGLDVQELKQDMQADEIKSILTGNIATAEALGIQGTPAFVVDETLVPGAVGFETLAAAIEAVRQDGGCKHC